MFCPKCAAKLVVADGELKCSATMVGFSPLMERALSDRFGNHLPSKNQGVTSIATNSWYCPGCGVLLDIDMRCPCCRLSLKDLHYQLVEFHPHRDIVRRRP